MNQEKVRESMKGSPVAVYSIRALGPELSRQSATGNLVVENDGKYHRVDIARLDNDGLNTGHCTRICITAISVCDNRSRTNNVLETKNGKLSCRGGSNISDERKLQVCPFTLLRCLRFPSHSFPFLLSPSLPTYSSSHLCILPTCLSAVLHTSPGAPSQSSWEVWGALCRSGSARAHWKSSNGFWDIPC